MAKKGNFSQTRNVMSINQVLLVQCKLITDNQMHFTHFQLSFAKKKHFWPQNMEKNEALMTPPAVSPFP